ncbi:hypothetical protein Vafri_16636 [Volvox africanus]|uniref:Uncharacterized protein n=1 Tax=Volvox africanus TaxID=51714 RepID=A0A8J4BP24_9CHLO|nr:hypothetical protein Vafri_16636 [Volvox africanus]
MSASNPITTFCCSPCACVYVCVCMCMCVRVCVCLRVYVYVYACMFVPQVLAEDMTGRIRGAESLKQAVLAREQADVGAQLDAIQRLLGDIMAASAAGPVDFLNAYSRLTGTCHSLQVLQASRGRGGGRPPRGGRGVPGPRRITPGPHAAAGSQG